jgi:hypothetical protein
MIDYIVKHDNDRKKQCIICKNYGKKVIKNMKNYNDERIKTNNNYKKCAKEYTSRQLLYNYRNKSYEYSEKAKIYKLKKQNGHEKNKNQRIIIKNEINLQKLTEKI